MVAKFRADSLFKATVQPDDKNSQQHILLVTPNYLLKVTVLLRLDRPTGTKFVCERFLHAHWNGRWTFSVQNTCSWRFDPFKCKPTGSWQGFSWNFTIWDGAGKCKEHLKMERYKWKFFVPGYCSWRSTTWYCRIIHKVDNWRNDAKISEFWLAAVFQYHFCRHHRFFRGTD